jgi:predicted AAA+ superfamily ATPase
MEYRRRTLDTQLDELCRWEPAVAIDGPKGVGKTATAQRRAAASWRLDDPAQLNVLKADLHFSTAPSGTLLIDEWQHLPEIWDSVRRRVDDGAPPGRFLLTGSATPRPGAGTHSGAGRIASVRMRPMALYERGVVDPSISLSRLLDGTHGDIAGHTSFTAQRYFESITRSGLPDLQELPLHIAQRRLDSYLQRVIDKDFPAQGYALRSPETLRRWLTAYAAASSSVTAYSRILDSTTSGDGVQPAKTTTMTYRDHLTQLWLLDKVPGWAPALNNPFKRLMLREKHQLADPAFAARLLGLDARDLASARGAHMAGPLFESLATLSVRVAASAVGARVEHLRTQNGDHEVDLIVESPDRRIIGVEVKLAGWIVDDDVKHLKWLKEHMGSDVVDLVVISSGPDAYRRDDGIAVVPLALLGE